MTSTNYQKIYETTYKKLPLINAILVMILTLAWAIVDYSVCITGIGDLEFFGCFAIWLLIGAVAAGIVAFLTAISISATIVRTDAILQIEKSIKNPTNKSIISNRKTRRPKYRDSLRTGEPQCGSLSLLTAE